MPTQVSTDQALAFALRRLRQESGGTQEDVAYSAGLTVGALARIERGTSNPRWTTVRCIADALGVSLAELVVVIENAAV